MRKIAFSFLIGIIFFSQISCQPILMLAIGMKNPNQLDEKDYRKLSRKLDIPKLNSFYIDTSYITFIESIPANQAIMQNHAQPIQALYFNESDIYPIAWYINCRAKPTTFSLLWNADSSFNFFPPKGNIKPDSLITKHSYTSLIHPVYPESAYRFSDASINVIVLYCKVYLRQSKRLIREVRSNAKLSSKPVNINYVNIDNLFYDIEKPEIQ